MGRGAYLPHRWDVRKILGATRPAPRSRPDTGAGHRGNCSKIESLHEKKIIYDYFLFNQFLPLRHFFTIKIFVTLEILPAQSPA